MDRETPIQPMGSQRVGNDWVTNTYLCYWEQTFNDLICVHYAQASCWALGLKESGTESGLIREPTSVCVCVFIHIHMHTYKIYEIFFYIYIIFYIWKNVYILLVSKKFCKFFFSYYFVLEYSWLTMLQGTTKVLSHTYACIHSHPDSPLIQLPHNIEQSSLCCLMVSQESLWNRYFYALFNTRVYWVFWGLTQSRDFSW